MYHVICCVLAVPAWVALGSYCVAAWRHVPCHMLCIGGARMGCGGFVLGFGVAACAISVVLCWRCRHVLRWVRMGCGVAACTMSYLVRRRCRHGLRWVRVGLWCGGMYHVSSCVLAFVAWVVLGSCWVVAWLPVPCHKLCVGGAGMCYVGFVLVSGVAACTMSLV